MPELRPPDGTLPTATSITAHAFHLGGRIHVRELPGHTAAATSPLTFPGRDGGFFVVLRFGALVALGTTADEEAEVRSMLRPQVENAEPSRGEERVEVRVGTDASEGPGPDGEICLHRLDTGRAQVVANVLGKSAVLTHYEERVLSVFDRVEVMARHLRDATAPATDKELLREIGETLLMRTSMVGRVEVSEKPETTWDDPALDRLYERLAFEFELADRDRALTRKLELVSDVAETYLELLDTRKSVRLEWYIIILIAVEIAIVAWEMLHGF